jgi:hypothetical protein
MSWLKSSSHCDLNERKKKSNKKGAVGSTGQRNGSFKGISRRLKAKRFSRPGVKAQCDLIKVMLRVDG